MKPENVGAKGSFRWAASPQAWNSIKYNRVVYGYGDKEGPTKLIGKKQLPVLTGVSVRETVKNS